jgi:hypothetical protein
LFGNFDLTSPIRAVPGQAFGGKVGMARCFCSQFFDIHIPNGIQYISGDNGKFPWLAVFSRGGTGCNFNNFSENRLRDRVGRKIPDALSSPDGFNDIHNGTPLNGWVDRQTYEYICRGFILISVFEPMPFELTESRLYYINFSRMLYSFP